MPKQDQTSEGRDQVLRSTEETIASRHPEGQAVVDAMHKDAEQAEYEAEVAKEKEEEATRKAEKESKKAQDQADKEAEEARKREEEANKN